MPSCLRLAGPALALSLAGCADLAAREPAQDSSADKPIAATFTKRFSVGGSNDTQLQLRMLFPKDVGADELGHLFVLEADERAVAIYDTTGKLLRKVGKRGKGPGELESPLGISVEAGGGFYVKDYSRRMLVGFFLSGRPSRDITTQSMGSPQEFASDRDGREIVVSNSKGRQQALRVFGRAGGADTLAVMTAPDWKLLDASKCGLSPDHSQPPIFSQRIVWTERFGHLAYVKDDSFVVHGITRNGGESTLRRRRAPDIATEAAAVRSMPDGWRVSVGGKNWCTIPAADVVKQIGFERTIPAYESLAIDNNGRIWALRTRLGNEPRRADLYQAPGGYLGTIVLGNVRPVSFMSNGALVSLETDADDAPVVVVYGVSGLPATARR